ncbi:Uncharacterized membrane protein [Amycolatopsis arida]|uniref:Uncharacterized membrane protein n=1 Tax=Amycolatopsis arida TaxID=587909 RepID=A0A1I5V979_9PSEU|nr:DUF2231 domain-containing protein [Amycolatopsis arida]TDX91191.1 putative membrane protein [Amycolatopsis arida]SFQ03907.1 Uncharacterized membrane protein [Amycolatopsis arida]
MSEEQAAKRPVNAALAGPYGHPFHPILVTVPIGAWVSSLVFDIGSHVVADPGFLARGSVWLIAIGVVGALAAAAVGALDLLAIPRGTRAFRTGLLHMSLNLLVVAAFVVNFLWRQAAFSQADAVAIGPLVLSAVTLAVLGVSGYLGGTLSYRYGVRVVEQREQAEAYRHATESRTRPAH